MGRTALNVAGAANTAVIVAASERQLNLDAYAGSPGRPAGTPTAAPPQIPTGTTPTPPNPPPKAMRRPSRRRRPHQAWPQLHLARPAGQDDEMCGIGLSGRR